MITDREFENLRRRVEALEQREREADRELKAALMRIVAHIERKYARTPLPQEMPINKRVLVES